MDFRWGADAFAGLKPEWHWDWRGDGNEGRGDNKRGADVTQAAAMLARVMRFQLICA